MVLTATGYVPIEANAGAGANPAANKDQPGAITDAAPVAQKQSLYKTFNPDQPRVAAGETGAGQWTSGEGGAANDLRVISDATPDDTWRPGVQYAALDTGARTDATEVTPKAEGNSTVQYAAADGVFWVTRNQTIDKISLTLLALLNDVTDGVGPRGSESPREYGTKIHTEFANFVRAQGLPGVEVEQTFGLQPNAPYGSKYSIRTDILLRDDAGQIIAIYDVKTGEASLEPSRVRELRARTGTTLDTYVFEIKAERGLMLKHRRNTLRLARFEK